MPEAGSPGLQVSALRRLQRSSAVRYLVVGGLAFLLDLGLLTLAYRVLDLPLWAATALGFWGSFAFTYYAQRRFSFGGVSPHGRSLVRYCLLLGVNTVATIGIVEAFERLGPGFSTGKVVAVVVQSVWNYFVYKHWVFSGPAGSRPRP